MTKSMRAQRLVLKAAMAAAALDVRGLAIETGIQVGSLNRYVRGHVRIGPKVAARLSRTLGIRETALLYPDRHVIAGKPILAGCSRADETA